jgi:HK97 family phage prohead protease
MEYKSFPAMTKDVEGRRVEGIASVFGVWDLGNDRIKSGAFKKTIKERRDEFRHLWQHDGREPPIATIREIEEVGVSELPKNLLKKAPDATGGLRVVREYYTDQYSDRILQAIQTGGLSQMSFGFDVVKMQEGEFDVNGLHSWGREIAEIKLYETSDVLWGMNQFTVASKAYLPFKDTGFIKSIEESWSVPTLSDFTDEAWEDLSDAQKTRIASHFAYRGEEDTFEALRFPHHSPSPDGVGKVNFSGVKDALENLKDSELSDTDAKMVYTHLSKHYAHWGKTPPALSVFQVARSLKDVLAIPGVLASSDYEVLKQLHDKVSTSLYQAEPETIPLTSELERRSLEESIRLAMLRVRGYDNHSIT